MRAHSYPILCPRQPVTDSLISQIQVFLCSNPYSLRVRSEGLNPLVYYLEMAKKPPVLFLFRSAMRVTTLTCCVCIFKTNPLLTALSTTFYFLSFFSLSYVLVYTLLITYDNSRVKKNFFFYVRKNYFKITNKFPFFFSKIKKS